MKNESQSAPIVSESFLLNTLGAAPSITEVAKFLHESRVTTWRRVTDGELIKLPGRGPARITLRSLFDFLNQPGTVYQKNPGRGRKPGKKNKTKQSAA